MSSGRGVGTPSRRMRRRVGSSALGGSEPMTATYEVRSSRKRKTDRSQGARKTTSWAWTYARWAVRSLGKRAASS